MSRSYNRKFRSSHELKELAHQTLFFSDDDRINDLVNQALGYFEKYRDAWPKMLYESAYVDFCHAVIVLEEVIPSHDEYEKFERKKSEFWASYQTLRQIVEKEDQTKLERMLDSRLEFKVSRKPVGAAADPLEQRFEKLRGPRPQPVEEEVEVESERPKSLYGSIPKSLQPQPLPQPQQSPPPPPQPRPIFPKTKFVNAETLQTYLRQSPESILLLDIRERRCFDAGRIAAPHVTCVEPITIKPGNTENDLEDSMVLSPQSERLDFESRGEFELVVYYDTESTQNTFGRDSVNDPQATALHYLVTTIHTYSFSKPLKRAPCLLVGGFRAWLEADGEIEPPNGQLLMPSGSPVQERAKLANGTSSPASHSGPVRDVNEFFRNDKPRHDLSPPKPSPAKPSPPAAGVGVAAPHQSRPQSPMYQFSKEFMCGLKNLGNTCYMNCIIQCIAGTPSFALPFADGSYSRYVNVNSRLGYRGMLARTFADLMQTMYNPTVQNVGPTALKSLSGRIRDTFSGTDQQDCQEFLTFILDGLHEELNASGHRERLKQLTVAEERRREELSVRQASAIEWERYLKSDYSLVVDTFQGQYQSRLQCLTCGFTSTTYSAFSSLTLPIPLNHNHVSLKDCFDLLTQQEVLDGDDAWLCSHCQCPRRSIKSLKIARLPQCLVVHLKRFHTTRNKLETFVSYPHHLDLTEYWPAASRDDEHRLSHMPSRGQSPPFKYALYAVANHFGTLKGGHYTSFVYKGRNHGWCYFDDDKISRHVNQSHVVNQHAYVLFYYRQ